MVLQRGELTGVARVTIKAKKGLALLGEGLAMEVFELGGGEVRTRRAHAGWARGWPTYTG